MQNPSITVLLPAYNCERYLTQAIESILNQTHKDFELIVVNDGSTDGTPQVLSRFQQDARLRVINQPNQGIVASLNNGLSEAKGEFIARMDGDDISLHDRLRVQLEYLLKRPALAGVGSQVIFIDPDGMEIGPKGDCVESPELVDAALMQGRWPVVHPSVLVRRDRLRMIGPYRNYHTWEDHDLFLRLSEVGGIGNVPIPLLKYRLHLQSIVHSRSSSKGDILKDLISEAHKRRGTVATGNNMPPGYKALTAIEHQRNWVWWSLQSGNLRTARKHAWRVFWKSPSDLESIRAFFCALRGR